LNLPLRGTWQRAQSALLDDRDPSAGGWVSAVAENGSQIRLLTRGAPEGGLAAVAEALEASPPTTAGVSSRTERPRWTVQFDEAPSGTRQREFTLTGRDPQHPGFATAYRGVYLTQTGRADIRPGSLSRILSMDSHEYPKWAAALVPEGAHVLDWNGVRTIGWVTVSMPSGLILKLENSSSTPEGGLQAGATAQQDHTQLPRTKGGWTVMFSGRDFLLTEMGKAGPARREYRGTYNPATGEVNVDPKRVW
jgi:hypothetical protein